MYTMQNILDRISTKKCIPAVDSSGSDSLGNRSSRSETLSPSRVQARIYPRQSGTIIHMALSVTAMPTRECIWST